MLKKVWKIFGNTRQTTYYLDVETDYWNDPSYCLFISVGV